MPLTFTVTPGLDVNPGYRLGQPRNATELLQQCSEEEYANCETMLQSSFSDDDLSSHNIEASHNGFVWSAIQAYNEHHNLVIRPDDVWLAILTQFSIYVNAHPQELRRQFMAHDDQIEFEIVHDGSLQTYDWAKFPQEMVSKLGQVVTDPGFQQWILPKFSTTEASDTVVCSVVMMSTLQHYVRYKLRTRCGIPAVTLLGEKSDWETILTRIAKLSSFGMETGGWSELLRTVISYFIKAFENPNSIENKLFWQKIARQTNNMSGVDYLDGWITAFCFWDEQGGRLHGRPGYQGLRIGAIEFYQVEIDEIPPGFATVPVKIDDNGQVYMARMIAGSMATRGYVNHRNFSAERRGNYNTLQPEVGWCVFKSKGKLNEEDISGGDKHLNQDLDATRLRLGI